MERICFDTLPSSLSAFLPPALPSFGPTLPLVLRAGQGEAALFFFFIGAVVYGGNDLVCRGRSEAASSSSSSSSSLSPSVPGLILPGLSICCLCCCKSDAAAPRNAPEKRPPLSLTFLRRKGLTQLPGHIYYYDKYAIGMRPQKTEEVRGRLTGKDGQNKDHDSDKM